MARQLQGVVYVSTQHPNSWGDAWTLANADLCVERSDPHNLTDRYFQLDSIAATVLVFVAGPNANHERAMLSCQSSSVAPAATAETNMLTHTDRLPHIRAPAAWITTGSATSARPGKHPLNKLRAGLQRAPCHGGA